MGEAEKCSLNFEIPKELNDQVEAECRRLMISKAVFVRMRLIEYFENKKKEEG